MNGDKIFLGIMITIGMVIQTFMIIKQETSLLMAIGILLISLMGFLFAGYIAFRMCNNIIELEIERQEFRDRWNIGGPP